MGLLNPRVTFPRMATRHHKNATYYSVTQFSRLEVVVQSIRTSGLNHQKCFKRCIHYQIN
jgi:hypothetical protein